MKEKTIKNLVIFAIVIIVSMTVFLVIKNNFGSIEESISRKSKNICDISSYGATTDKKKLNTKAFAQAVEDCAKKGGGMVNVPPGTWRTGAIHLKSNITLNLEKDAIIKFDTNLENYLPEVFSRFEGVEYYNYSPLIYATGAQNIAITGQGELDGQGENWKRDDILRQESIEKLFQMVTENIPPEKRNLGKKGYLIQPSFIQFVNCNGILIKGITIRNSPNWTIHPVYSENIIIQNITIDTDGPNTDGIAIDSSKNVLIEKSKIRSGDDAIALKSGADKDGRRVNIPSENITIRDIAISGAHSAIALGSEMSGGIKNVIVEDIRAQEVKYGIRMKSVPSRGGIVEKISFDNVDIDRASEEAILIDLKYREIAENEERNPPVFRNITIENFKCAKTKNAAVFLGLPDSPIENLKLKNVRISAKEKIYSEYLKNEKYEKMKIEIRD